MKPFANQTNDRAALVIETILLGMRTIRSEMRRGKPVDLSVPQFRVLAFLSHNTAVSLSKLAEHMGLGLPSMSKTVDVLVHRHLVIREAAADDRRRITLRLTDQGADAFKIASAAARKCIAGKLEMLTQQQRDLIAKAMSILVPMFASEPEGKK